MGVEIEKKFLIDESKIELENGTFYKQGYLNQDKYRTVRIRVAGERGYITIKGVTEKSQRAEFEYEIPLSEAEDMLDNLCLKPLIEKKRYLVQVDNKTWEIDKFFGENSGLIVAEIELRSIDEDFTKPEWVVKEVSDDSRYYNSNLAKTPYSKW